MKHFRTLSEYRNGTFYFWYAERGLINKHVRSYSKKYSLFLNNQILHNISHTSYHKM